MGNKALEKCAALIFRVELLWTWGLQMHLKYGYYLPGPIYMQKYCGCLLSFSPVPFASFKVSV